MWYFERSDYFYLLLVLPALAGLLLYNHYWKRKKQKEFGDPALVKKLSPEKSTFKSAIKVSFLLIATAALIVALVNPQLGKSSENVKREGIDIVFAIDVSKSMLAEDVAPNRLDKSKQLVSQVISTLGTDRIGMVGYAGSAYPVLPMTTDFGMARMYLQGLNTDAVSSQGTAIGDAIKLSSSFFDNPKAGKVIVLVSDGEDHGEGTGKIAEEALEKGIRIITVGVGTEDGGPIPVKEDGVTESLKRDSKGDVVITRLVPEELKTIAETTNGGYVYAGSTRETAAQIKKLMESVQKMEYESRNIAGRDSKYQWFAWLAFLLLFLDILVPEKKSSGSFNLFRKKGL